MKALIPLVLLLAFVSGIPALVYCAAMSIPVIRNGGASFELWPSKPWLERGVVLGLLALTGWAALVYGRSEL